ncbi:MAG TPA: hypothetical protein VGO36_06055 [Solirubrobacterales bacterium]|nr:hypothetical protein [Solirubrobacterales bacterium]
MPFHIEINSAVNHARVLNVDREALVRTVLEPWVAGLPFELDESEWEPRESRLTILEGPSVQAGEGEPGWEAMLRAAEDVTRALLEEAEASAPEQTAAVVEADSVEAALEALRRGQSLRQLPWSKAVEKIERRDPAVAGVILVVKPPGLAWPRP